MGAPLVWRSSLTRAMALRGAAAAALQLLLAKQRPPPLLLLPAAPSGAACQHAAACLARRARWLPQRGCIGARLRSVGDWWRTRGARAAMARRDRFEVGWIDCWRCVRIEWLRMQGVELYRRARAPTRCYRGQRARHRQLPAWHMLAACRRRARPPASCVAHLRVAVCWPPAGSAAGAQYTGTCTHWLGHPRAPHAAAASPPRTHARQYRTDGRGTRRRHRRACCPNPRPAATSILLPALTHTPTHGSSTAPAQQHGRRRAGGGGA